MIFNEDHRQKNINEMRKRIPKGCNREELSIGDLIYVSSNLSTGDRSYCDVLLEIEGITASKSHATVKYVPKYDFNKEGVRRTVLFLPEFEVYKYE